MVLSQVRGSPRLILTKVAAWMRLMRSRYTPAYSQYRCPNASIGDALFPAHQPVAMTDQQGSVLARLVEQFDTVIRGVARTRGFTAAEIDELVQEIRVRLWRSQPSEQNLERIGASYVQRVAMTAAIDMLRRRRSRREDSLDQLAATPETPAVLQVPPKDGADDAEIACRLELALAHLPRNRRLVVQLHLEGYARPEIAALTGWTDDKVRNLLYRGLDDLRERLRSVASTSASRVATSEPRSFGR